jgi:methyltransferase (TIGR00027 family)
MAAGEEGRGVTDSESDLLVRNVSDTARWVAAYRARETERPDALFHDAFARRLAGERGERIATALGLGAPGGRGDWPIVVRTLLFDEFIRGEVTRGVDLVVNLAAGLDMRPYRLDLPPSLRWVEVDLPGILDYKEEVIGAERPRCALERVRLDLADFAARRELFARLAASARRVAVVTEGLLIYLTAEEVGGLGRDLAAAGPSFERWMVDLTSPGLRHRLSHAAGPHLDAANAPFKFSPPEGPGFFAPFGWRALGVRSFVKEAARVKRIPWWMRLLTHLPESQGRQGVKPWAAVVLLERG